MPTLDATVYPNEAYVLVQARWPLVTVFDNFQRTEGAGFMVATSGQTWTNTGGLATDYTTGLVAGFWVATTSNATVNVLRHSFIPLIHADAEVRVEGFTFGVATALGASMNLFTMVRATGVNDYYASQFRLATSGAVELRLYKRVGGVLTNIAGPFTVALTNTATTRYDIVTWVRGNMLYAKAWLSGTPEPAVAQTSMADTDLTSGNQVGFVSRLEPGNVNPLPVLFTVDTFSAFDLNFSGTECATVSRRNTVTGEVVQLRPYVFYDEDGALMLECGQGLWWDTEPALNVALEYCTTACDVPMTLTANPGFETDALGWTATGGALTQDCAAAKVGTCSGRLTPGGTLTNPSLSQSGITMVAGREVTMSTWAMSPQGWNSVLLRLVVTYADLTSQTLETDRVTLDDGEWRYLSLSFIPAQAASATFSFIAAGLPPNTTLFNVDELKVTQLVDVTDTACETVTVPSESVWLKSPLHPCDDVEVGLCSPMLDDCEDENRVSYVGTFDDSYGPNTVLLEPANQRRPIPINRVRRDAVATLRLLAHDCEAKDAVLQINEPGDPLLFQAPADYCIPDRYISVGTEEETRISVDQREDFRLMTLPYAVVNRPEGPMDGPCGARIDDLCDIYTSWNALSIAGLTWTDLLLGLASPNGPGQPAPPAGARTWDDVEAEFVDWDAVEAGGTRDWDELRDGL